LLIYRPFQTFQISANPLISPCEILSVIRCGYGWRR